MSFLFTAADKNGLLEWIYRDVAEPELPDGYVRLDHISSDGTGQYIDTGIVPDSHTSVRARFRNYQKSGFTIPFGLAYSAGRYCFAYPQGSQTVSWQIYWGDKNPEWSNGKPVCYGLHDVWINALDGIFSIDNYAQKADATFTSEGALYIFARNDNGTAGEYAPMDFYSFTMSTNGVLARSFVPAHRTSDRAAGLYDTVEGRFYPNNGMGTFSPVGGFVEVDGERVFGRTVGESYTYMVPTQTVTETAILRRRCTGWRFTRTDGTTREGTGSSATLEFAAADDAGRLEWLWSEASRANEIRRSAFTFAIDAVTGPLPLTNFPTLVRISSERVNGFEYSQCAADGSDIRFSMSPNGADSLTCEVDTWSPEGESLFWVKLPEVANGTTFYMFWGDGTTQTRTPTAVWTDYAGVWHFNEAVNDSFADSVQNGHALSLKVADPVKTLSVDTGIARIGSAKAGTGSLLLADYLAIVSSSRGDGRRDTYALSGWFHVPSQFGTTSLYYPFSAHTGPEHRGWFMEAYGASYLKSHAYVPGYGNTSSYVSIPDYREEWVHVAISAEEGMAYVLINGARVPGTSFPMSLLTEEGTPLELPTDHLDEVRLCKQTLSADWVRSEYRQVADTAFLTAEAAVLFEKPQKSGTLVLFR